MRHHPLIAIDEYLPAGTISTSAVISSKAFDARLALGDGLTLQASLDHITPDTADRNLLVFLDHSADGLHWIQRSNQVGSRAAADANLKLVIKGTSPGPASKLVTSSWTDGCQGVSSAGGAGPSAKGPLLGFVRLFVFFDNAVTAGHLRITAVPYEAD